MPRSLAQRALGDWPDDVDGRSCSPIPAASHHDVILSHSESSLQSLLLYSLQNIVVGHIRDLGDTIER